MSKTTAIVGGIIIVAAIIWGVMYVNRSGVDGSLNATTTSSTTTSNTNTTTIAGTPIVTTKSLVVTTDNAVIVDGNIIPKGALTSYWYEYGLTSSLGSRTSSQIIGSGFSVISAPGLITGLTKNTSYSFRLVGENRYGKVFGTTYTFKTTEGTPAPIGGIPVAKTVMASSVSRTTADLNGEVTPNKVTTQYWFEYGKTTELGNISAFSSAGNGALKTAVSVSLSNLEPLTTYYFRLNAQNQFGTVNGSILNFKTIGPASAEVPTVNTGNATAVTPTGATLNGKVNPNLADTKYWFEYSTDSLLGQILLKSTVLTSIGAGEADVSVKQNITGLNSKTTYYFRLVAQNNLGTVSGDKQTFKTK